MDSFVGSIAGSGSLFFYAPSLPPVFLLKVPEVRRWERRDTMS